MKNNADLLQRNQETNDVSVWRELLIMTKYGIPFCVTYVLNYLPLLLIVAFAGHFGLLELDAMGLNITYLSMTTISVGIGISFAVQGEFAQAFGAGDRNSLRENLHRSLIIATIIYFIFCFPLNTNSEAILVLLHQNRNISHLTGNTIIIGTPATFAYLIFEVLLRFFLAQELIFPCFISAVLYVLVFLILSATATIIFNWGFYCLPVALSISIVLNTIFVLVFQFMYQSQRELGILNVKKTCLQHWGYLFRLIIPSIIQC